jgi:hypothetical protein
MGRRRRRGCDAAALAALGAWLAALAAGAAAQRDGRAGPGAVLLAGNGAGGAGAAASASAELPGFGARNALLGAAAPGAGRAAAAAAAVWATPLFARALAGSAQGDRVRVAWLNGTTVELPAAAVAPVSSASPAGSAPASSAPTGSAPPSSGGAIPFTVAAQPWSEQYLDVAPDRPSRLVYYSIAAVEQYLNYAPISWYVLGSADRVQWWVLDAQRNVSWSALRAQTFHVNLPANASSTFSVYRILVTRVEGCGCASGWSAVVLDKVYLYGGFLDEPGQGGNVTVESGGGSGADNTNSSSNEGGNGANSTDNANNKTSTDSAGGAGAPFRASTATQVGLGIASFLVLFAFIILCYVGRRRTIKRRREREALELEHAQARAAPPVGPVPGPTPRSPARSPFVPMEPAIPAEEMGGECPSLSPSLRPKPRLHSDGSHTSWNSMRSSGASTSSLVPRASRTEDTAQPRTSVASKVSTFLRGSRTDDKDSPTFAVAPAESAQASEREAFGLPKGRSARKSVSDVL